MILQPAAPLMGLASQHSRGSRGPGCRAIPRLTLLSSETWGPQRSAKRGDHGGLRGRVSSSYLWSCKSLDLYGN